ncbi:MAG: hypothetical protein JW768_02445 [Chitinispirillaceae bacterium]|nr:hypothetical protein [Chitinispirillaceae bacterium]
MPVKIQYNKTFLNQLTRDLRIRENALPILCAKESALRFEVQRARGELAEIEKEIAVDHTRAMIAPRLWNEFERSMFSIENVALGEKIIAGVKTPVLKDIAFSIAPYSVFEKPFWLPEGLEQVKRTVTLRIREKIALEKVRILEIARKKTTQKVNLYQKVLIPEYQEAIRKIKRFLEDEENLSKSSQKILKSRRAAARAAA